MARKINCKNRHYARLYNRYKLLALNIFEWKGLDQNEKTKGISSRHIEQALYLNGQAIFYQDKDLGLICLPCSDTGYYNVFGESTRVIANGYNKNQNVEVMNSLTNSINTSEFNYPTGVRINNNDLFLPTHDYVSDYAEKMYNVENCIELNIKQQKFPWFVNTTQNNKKTLEILFKAIENGDYAILGNKTVNIDDMHVLNLQTPYVVDKLQQYKYDLEREILTFFGMNNSFEKKERLVVDEVNSNNEFIEKNIEHMLKCRKEACDFINKTYGLNLSVEKINYLENENLPLDLQKGSE